MSPAVWQHKMRRNKKHPIPQRVGRKGRDKFPTAGKTQNFLQTLASPCVSQRIGSCILMNHRTPCYDGRVSNGEKSPWTVYVYEGTIIKDTHATNGEAHSVQHHLPPFFPTIFKNKTHTHTVTPPSAGNTGVRRNRKSFSLHGYVFADFPLGARSCWYSVLEAYQGGTG